MKCLVISNLSFQEMKRLAVKCFRFTPCGSHTSPLATLRSPNTTKKNPMDGGGDHWWNDGFVPSDDASAEDQEGFQGWWEGDPSSSEPSSLEPEEEEDEEEEEEEEQQH